MQQYIEDTPTTLNRTHIPRASRITRSKLMLQIPWKDWPLPTHKSTTVTSDVPHINTTISSICFYLSDIVLEFYIESFYSPLGSHVGAQFLILFCLLTLDLMMIAWRSKHVLNNNRHVIYVLITLYIVALTSIVIYYLLLDATVCSRIYFTAKSLYMFRVSTAPIIRSTKNCNRSLQSGQVGTLATLEGGSCTDTMTCTGRCGYSF